MNRSVRIVASHYDNFPYPTPRQIVQQLPGSFSLGALNFLLLRKPGEWLPPNARIWVAGCGTQQGAMWALSNPDAEIFATDISRSALEIAAGIATQIGVKNLSFEQRDLAGSDFRNRFDLVVCTGVLHHLPDPASGLARIRDSLKPNGALQLMVYSRMHREPFAHFRSAFDLLCPEKEELSHRYELARHLLEVLAASDRCHPAGHAAIKLLAEQSEDRSQLADALLHPLEASYDVDELLSLLDAAALRHISWLYPSQWDLENYLESPELTSRFSQLGPEDCWKVVYFIAGRAGPLFELLAEPEGHPPREPYSEEELLKMKMVCSQGVNVYRVQNGLVDGLSSNPAYSVLDGNLAGRERGAYGMRRKWSLPAEFQQVLRACDGSRTLAQVLDEFGEIMDRRSLFDTLVEFLPMGLGLIAPSSP